MGQSSAVTDERAVRPGPRPPLDEGRLAGLAGLAGFTVEVVAEAGSTNAVVADRARAGAAHGLVVVAEHQTAGRGRLDRTWETPPRAALTLSALVRPTVEAGRWPWLPLLCGVALADAVDPLVEPTGGGSPRVVLKWPNDVLVDDRKVAGILVERVDTPAGPAAVLGIGVNVTTTPAELPDPPPGAPPPTSLLLALLTDGATDGAEGPDRTALLADLLLRLGERYDAWQRPDGQARLHAAYTARCRTSRDEPVAVDLPSGVTVTGVGRAITDDGALRVDTATGSVTVSAGDVRHVRIRPDR